MISAYRQILYYCLLVFVSVLPLTAAEIQFLNESDSTKISYERFCEIMDQQEGARTNDKEPFCTEANMTMHSGLPFVKSLAQLFGLRGAILQEDTTNEGTSGDAFAQDGPRYFGLAFYNTLEAKVFCKNIGKISSCHEIHRLLEEEIQSTFFFVVSKKTNQYYYFTKTIDSASGEVALAHCILLGEFAILDSSLHAESQKIFREYTRKYGKPNYMNVQKGDVDTKAWKDKSGKYLYLVRFKVGEDLLHNFGGLEEFSVDKIYAGPLYSSKIALIKLRVLDKVKSIKRENEAAQKKLLDDAIK